MGDPPTHTDAETPSAGTDEANHLRTIAFRLREIQRLLAMRVEQENRRLDANGLDPVTDTRFREAPPDD